MKIFLILLSVGLVRATEQLNAPGSLILRYAPDDPLFCSASSDDCCEDPHNATHDLCFDGGPLFYLSGDSYGKEVGSSALYCDYVRDDPLDDTLVEVWTFMTNRVPTHGAMQFEMEVYDLLDLPPSTGRINSSVRRIDGGGDAFLIHPATTPLERRSVDLWVLFAERTPAQDTSSFPFLSTAFNKQCNIGCAGPCAACATYDGLDYIAHCAEAGTGEVCNVNNDPQTCANTFSCIEDGVLSGVECVNGQCIISQPGGQKTKSLIDCTQYFSTYYGDYAADITFELSGPQITEAQHEIPTGTVFTSVKSEILPESGTLHFNDVGGKMKFATGRPFDHLGEQNLEGDIFYGILFKKDKEAGKCAGYCGYSSTAPGGCYCDDACRKYGDCCYDVCETCYMSCMQDDLPAEFMTRPAGFSPTTQGPGVSVLEVAVGGATIFLGVLLVVNFKRRRVEQLLGE